MSDKTYPITLIDFVKYKKYVRKWLAILSCKDWHYNFVHSVESEDSLAEIGYDFKNRSSTFYLAKKYDVKLTERLIEESAFHEVCHLLLAELVYKAKEKYSASEVDENVHAVIRTLENVIINGMR